MFIAVGNSLAAVSSVATVPKSALIPIFLEPVTFILPAVSLVILSLALLIKTIPVFPAPPETLIILLFKTFPVYALIEAFPDKFPSSNIAIPDESEFPPAPEMLIFPLFSKVIF